MLLATILFALAGTPFNQPTLSSSTYDPMAFTTAAVAARPAVPDCNLIWGEDFPLPPYECEEGQPDPECAEAAAADYVDRVAQAKYDRCMADNAASDTLDHDVADCLAVYRICLVSEDPPPEYCATNYGLCCAQAAEHYATTLVYNLSTYLGEQFFAEMDYYDAMAECCE